MPDTVRSPLLGTAGSWGSLLPAKATVLMNDLSETVERSARKALKNFYVAKVVTPNGARHVTRLDVVLRTDPFDPRSLPALERLQAWLRDKLPIRKGSLSRSHEPSVTCMSHQSHREAGRR